MMESPCFVRDINGILTEQSFDWGSCPGRRCASLLVCIIADGQEGSLKSPSGCPLGLTRFKFRLYTAKVGQKREMVEKAGIDSIMVIFIPYILVFVAVYIRTTTEHKYTIYKDHTYINTYLKPHTHLFVSARN